VKSHSFDPISLVLGLITVAAAIAAVNNRLGNLINDRPDALLPLIVLVIGLLAVVTATRRILQPAPLEDVDGARDDQGDSAE
jgi:hypothetical protein